MAHTEHPALLCTAFFKTLAASNVSKSLFVIISVVTNYWCVSYRFLHSVQSDAFEHLP